MLERHYFTLPLNTKKLKRADTPELKKSKEKA
jgi:hypothetical protein